MKDNTPPRRHWFRYSLRTLLVGVTLCCLWLGMPMEQARRQREAVQAVLDVSGEVIYDYQDGRPKPEPPGPHWLRRIVGDDYFQNVVDVNLHSTRAGDAMLRKVGNLRRLQTLDIGATHVTNDGLASIAGLAHLGDLSIAFTRVDDRGLAHLAGLSNLARLDLSRTLITDAGLDRLASLKNLRSLDLSFTKITDRGLQTLAASCDLDKLILDEVRITDAGLGSLVRMKNLRTLSLRQSNDPDEPRGITAAGVFQVAKVATLRKLTLANIEVTDEFLDRLTTLKKLQVFDLQGPSATVTLDAVERLEAAVPGLKIKGFEGGLWHRLTDRALQDRLMKRLPR